MSVHWKNASFTAALIFGVFAWGCGKTPETPKKDAPKAGGSEKADPHAGHKHEHGGNVAEVGAYHAILEAHASEGELDLGFETHEGHKPVALPLTGFTAQAKVDGGAFQEIKFEPADAKERPKDEKEGTASKFSAKLPGLKDAKKIYVAAKIKIDGKEETVEFKDIDPKAAAHKH